MIYLDSAATTAQKPETVIDAVASALANNAVNAGRGSYAAARKAVEQIEECRMGILRIARASVGYDVFFFPSATIALNQIILGLEVNQYSAIYASPFEHNAVMRPLNHICDKNGSKLVCLPFNREDWSFDEQVAEAMFLLKKPEYVFVSMVSNTTGYILPVEQITKLAHRYGARVIVDCAQALGSIDHNYAQIDADAYIFAGHKTLYGPFGVGGIILKKGWDIKPGLFGGTGSDSLNLNMPSIGAGGLEPGSPDITAIIGLNAAIKWINEIGIERIEKHERHLISTLADELSRIDLVNLFIPPYYARSGILAFAVEGYQAHEVGEILDDEFDIALRTGYQCAPWVHDWLGTIKYGGVVRTSASWFTQEADIETLIRGIQSL